MNTEKKDIIIHDYINLLTTDIYQNYLAHAYCIAGRCRFIFNGKEFELQSGDVMIVRKGELIEKIQPSDDFCIKVIYVTPEFIELCTPQSNYGMKGQLSLFLNPIMRLTARQQSVCYKNFEIVESRLKNANHHFHRETLINAMQMTILDFFDFHACLYEDNGNITNQSASIMSRFLQMLEDRTYRNHRDVSHYASELCVSPKYLSEVSKRVSGYAANYWINRYTILDISRLLRNKSMSFVQISDLFNFSSPAYFSRYVQHYLGLNPTDYRGQN
ncbi:MAG: helix-turn-helix transcriptional regulator [Bacteroidales bacterium]